MFIFETVRSVHDAFSVPSILTRKNVPGIPVIRGVGFLSSNVLSYPMRQAHDDAQHNDLTSLHNLNQLYKPVDNNLKMSFPCRLKKIENETIYNPLFQKF